MVIEKYDKQGSPLNFDYLRLTGIGLLQKYCDNWTDFNVHDPGVTILEYLCFALTDLAYRTMLFPVEDILTKENGEINIAANSFFGKSVILTTSPVTGADLRKYILEHAAINDNDYLHNIWLNPLTAIYTAQYLKSIYNVKLHLREDYRGSVKNNEITVGAGIPAVKKNIRDVFMHCRPLCTDIDNITVLEPQKIKIEGEIELRQNPGRSPEEILAAIYDSIINTLNPRVKYYTEGELINRGFSVDAIYNGPALQHGFIIDNELPPEPCRIEINDIERAIMAIKEVALIRSLRVFNTDGTQHTEVLESVINIKEDHFLYLEIVENRALELVSNNYNIAIQEELFLNYFNNIREPDSKKYIAPKTTEQTKFGRYRQIDTYYSIQKHFPAIYRIGEEGIEEDSVPGRKAKAKQLKAYLMLFEQLMANYLAQLNNIDHLFSPLDSGSAGALEKLTTYFSQPLYNVPFYEQIIINNSATRTPLNPGSAPKNTYVKALKNETEEGKFERKNRALNFMLARFNILLEEHPVFLFIQVNKQGGEKLFREELLKWKSGILKNIIPFTQNRALADCFSDFDLQQGKNSALARGFCYNMRKLLYIGLGQDVNDSLTPFNARITKHDSDRKDRNTHIITFKDVNNQSVTVYTNDSITAGEKGNFKHLFTNITASFFSNAIDKKNFMVCQVGTDVSQTFATGTVLLLYKEASQVVYTITGSYTNAKDANNSRDEIITKIREYNIRSEKMYAVEHTFLAPCVTSRSFGFEYYDTHNHIIFCHATLMTFAAREELIKKIYYFFYNYESLDRKSKEYSDLYDAINGAFLVRSIDDKMTSELDMEDSLSKLPPQKLDRLRKIIVANKDTHLRLLKYNVNIRGHKIDEAFFGNKISMIFPAWPARFAKESFRITAETIIQAHSPSFINCNTYWLSPLVFARFEELYKAWQEDVVATDRKNRNMDLCYKLILMLEGFKKDKH